METEQVYYLFKKADTGKNQPTGIEVGGGYTLLMVTKEQVQLEQTAITNSKDIHMSDLVVILGNELEIKKRIELTPKEE